MNKNKGSAYFSSKLPSIGPHRAVESGVAKRLVAALPGPIARAWRQSVAGASVSITAMGKQRYSHSRTSRKPSVRVRSYSSTLMFRSVRTSRRAARIAADSLRKLSIVPTDGA